MFNVLSKLNKYFLDSNYRFLVNASLHMYDKMPDRLYIEKKYQATHRRQLDLENPITFNEKLQWLKLNDRRPEYPIFVDKYEVRRHIEQKIGSQYLIPILGIWDDPSDIDFKQLPDRFVLKCTHNSGLGMYICKDKSRINERKVRAGLRRGLKQDYYLTGREWPYKNIKHRIIAEQYMTNESTDQLIDYKVHNFNGVPKVILVCSDRFSQDGLKEDFFDVEWNHLPVARPDHPNSRKAMDKPKELDEIIKLAKSLSEGYTFIRTDFYIINGKVYFGELTLFPTSGFDTFVPDKYDRLFGDMIVL